MKKYRFAIKYFFVLVRQHITRKLNKKENVYQIRNKKTGFWETVSFFNFYLSTVKVIIEKF